MSLFDLLLDNEERQTEGDRINGVVVGIVTNNQDPEAMGRVKVRFPWLSDTDESHWARIAAPMAGNQRGVYFLPEVEDEVLVAFEHGDPRFPYVLGALWNGRDAPPVTNDGKNNIRIIKSRSGHVIRLSDEDGNEKIEIVDKSEKNSVVIETASNTITITAGQDIVLSASSGTIKLAAKNIEMESSTATKIKAGTDMNAEAAVTMNIKGGMVNIN